MTGMYKRSNYFLDGSLLVPTTTVHRFELIFELVYLHIQSYYLIAHHFSAFLWFPSPRDVLDQISTCTVGFAFWGFY